jgi:RNA polymerase sigma-70 factor (ECF subfamily)
VDEQDAMSGDGWLAHATALRSLAAALTGDAGDADDLLQETWLRTARDERRLGQPRAWWSAVVRNLARDRGRERSRRAHSEREAARGESLPSEVEMLERLEVAQRVAAEVARLDEPYRTAIHLRYFEGLSPEQIAQRSNAPLETIRARLRRGLAQLRERMDRACGGDRSAWSVALAAIALRGKPTALATVGGSILSIGGVLMSAKLALGSAAALVLGVGAYLLWPTNEAAKPQARDVVEAAAPADLAPLVAEKSASIEPPAARVEATPPAPTPPTAAPVDDGTFEVRGTVVIVDESGAEHRDTSGSFYVVFGTKESDAKSQELAYEKGAWSLRIPKGGFLGFFKLVVGGREAALPRQSRPMQPGPDPIELRGRWVKRGRLHVIDAVTKQELRDIEIRYAKGWRANPDWTHPGDFEDMSVSHMPASPFDLPERLTLTPYWVRVAGYAWTRIDFDHEAGGDRTVELVAPASINVSIAGGSTPNGACVRLYPKQRVSYAFEARVSVHAAASGATRIDELEPGHYFGCVEVGEDEGRQRLGETPVDLVANQVTEVTVTIDASKLDVPMVHLFGTLSLPAGYGDAVTTDLSLWREGGQAQRITLKAKSMKPVDGNELVRSWDAGSVPAGVWGANVRPAMYRQVIHAESPGELRVEISVPKLISVSIDISDAVTGEALVPEHIMWGDARIEGLSQGFRSPVQALATKGAYRFEAPAGTVNLSCDTKGYATYQQDLELRDEPISLHIKLQRGSGVHVEVFEGDARLRVGFDFFDGMRCTIPGERRSFGLPGGRDTEFEWTRMLDPGHYELKFPALEGYEPIEMITVDVAAGQMVEVPVHVKRKP